MLLFCDNFSIYGANRALMLNGLYADANMDGLVNDPDGVSGGHVTQMTNSAELRYPIQGVPDKTTGVGVRLWMDALPVQTNGAQGHGGLGYQFPAIYFKDASNNVILELGVTTTGRLRLLSNLFVGGAFDISSTVPVVGSNGWFHIEIKMRSDGANNSICEVQVEGLPVAGLALPAGFDPGEAYQVSLAVDAYGSGGGPATHYKDLVVWNGAGAYNDDFLGTVIVALLEPTADVALNWTPTGGATGAEILSAIPPNDAAYIDAPNPPPAAYVAAMSDLSPDVSSVKGVMTIVRAGKTDGGDGFLQTGLISSPANAPATALGANRPITVAQTYWTDIFEVDPKTNAPWLPSAVNAAEIQLNRTA